MGDLTYPFYRGGFTEEGDIKRLDGVAEQKFTLRGSATLLRTGPEWNASVFFSLMNSYGRHPRDFRSMKRS
ncbi:MAG: hypothetical protein AMJ89_02780 [candidate division Zixibacteria bacterium SM23_73]|nr:MAG: hypothetical protein AMJ89_02780 [candidate division Zixibacteria bacterium SM23_73]